MKNRKRLNNVFKDWLTTGGIFHELDEFNVPWKLNDISTELDLQYHGNHSGDKFISPLINTILDGAENLTSSNKALLASTVYSLYGENWAKQWETLSFEYNPIENYSMTETMTDDEKVTEYGKTSTRTDNLTDTNTPNLTASVENSVHAFNSSNAVPSSETEQSTGGTNTDTHTGTQAYVDSGSDTETRNYELTRTGNIGTMTSQQMIESERNLWMWKYFETVVFPDIDRVLTIPIY